MKNLADISAHGTTTTLYSEADISAFGTKRVNPISPKTGQNKKFYKNDRTAGKYIKNGTVPFKTVRMVSLEPQA